MLKNTLIGTALVAVLACALPAGEAVTAIDPNPANTALGVTNHAVYYASSPLAAETLAGAVRLDVGASLTNTLRLAPGLWYAVAVAYSGEAEGPPSTNLVLRMPWPPVSSSAVPSTAGGVRLSATQDPRTLAMGVTNLVWWVGRQAGLSTNLEAPGVVKVRVEGGAPARVNLAPGTWFTAVAAAVGQRTSDAVPGPAVAVPWPPNGLRGE